MQKVLLGITNKSLKVKIAKSTAKAIIPTYANFTDVGLDLVAIENGKEVCIGGTKYLEYRTGLHIEIPIGHAGLIFPRSSISNKTLFLANSVGVIDPGYRGEIKCRFKHDGITSLIDKYGAGDRIAQLIIIPYPKIEFEEIPYYTLSNTERGSGGFGSTGK